MYQVVVSYKEMMGTLVLVCMHGLNIPPVALPGYQVVLLVYSSTVLDFALQWFRFNVTLVRAIDVVVVSEFLLDLEIAKYDDRQRSTSSTIFVIKVHSLASARFFLAN